MRPRPNVVVDRLPGREDASAESRERGLSVKVNGIEIVNQA
jgi:hypothetical protein